MTEWTLDHYDATAFEKINNQQLLIAANNAKYPKTLKKGKYAIKLDSKTNSYNCIID
jgi:hypothetical protein